MYDMVEKWRLSRDLKNLYERKFREVIDRESPGSERFEALSDQYIHESAPMRARLMEIESGEVVARAVSLGIVIADLQPLRFGNPLWREEAGCRYLSEEGKQAVKRAINTAKRERVKWALTWLTPAIGLVGALTGLLAVLLRH